MIRSDYQPYFQELKSRMTELGYFKLEESELVADFLLYSGWIIRLECERYYGPMFEIFVVPPENFRARRDSYGVALLMLVFEKITGKQYGKPTLENEMNFLVQEKNHVLSDPAFYEIEYSKLNDISAE